MVEDWKTMLGEKLISAEAAAGLVKSGHSVCFTIGREPYAFGLALASRMSELEKVRVLTYSPGYDFGWYDEGWQDAFEVMVSMPTAVCQEAVDARRVDVHPGWLFNLSQPVLWMREPDILVTEVSTPDERGYCSFGQSLWNKKRQVQTARAMGIPVIAEVNKSLIRTYGDNFIHISEIDYFVEHVSSGGAVATGTLAGRARKAPEPYLKDIAGYVSELIEDGDTLQIGVGRTSEPMVTLGAFEGKRDLGYHSEATTPGVIRLVREGVINGTRKSVNKGKVVVTSLGGGTKEEMLWASGNPIFTVNDIEDVGDIRVIASHDNMVALNNALMMDLSGQMTAETLGSRIMSVAGGQVPFVTGALLSKGGRAIHVMPSTALGGKASRIVPELPAGTVVTLPRYSMDYVVTEYGIARLYGKSLRERALALIAIAHPDFRSELKAEAQRRLWP